MSNIAAATASYSFLSQPPPQKYKANQTVAVVAPLSDSAPRPSSSRRRSTTLSASISNWARAVQPGSPTPRTPNSPHRRRPSLVKGISHGRAASGSFMHLIDTPTTSTSSPPAPHTAATPSFDLTTLGYASVFLSLPTPKTPDIVKRSPEPTSQTPMKRLRSFSILRPLRSRSKSVVLNGPSSPTKPKVRSSSPSRSKSSTVIASKKAKYTKATLPPTLANELLLMQFADGGSMNSNVKRVMDSRAKEAANYGTKSTAVAGVDDVFRDGQGAVWWDQEEEWEYAHLLGGASASVPSSPSWVRFGKDNTAVLPSSPLSPAQFYGGRRESAATQGSAECDPTALVTPAGEDELTMGRVLLQTKLQNMALADLRAFGLDTSSTSTEKRKGIARRRPAPLNITPSSLSNTRAEDAMKDYFDSSFAPSPAADGIPVPFSAPATKTQMQMDREVKRRGLVHKASKLFFGRKA